MLPSERDPASDFTFTGNRSWHIIAFVLRRGIFFFFSNRVIFPVYLEKDTQFLLLQQGLTKKTMWHQTELGGAL